MFSEVFVCPQGGLGLCPGGSLSRGGLCRGSLSMGISVWGVSVHEGLCLGDPPPPYGNERAVRILLGCILDSDYYCKKRCGEDDLF